MKILINKKLANSTMQVEIEECQDKEAMLKATFFLTPDICGLCKATNVTWEGRRAKADNGTFLYISRKYMSCAAQSTMGEYKDGGYFWKKWEVYRGHSETED